MAHVITSVPGDYCHDEDKTNYFTAGIHATTYHPPLLNWMNFFIGLTVTFKTFNPRTCAALFKTSVLFALHYEGEGAL